MAISQTPGSDGDLEGDESAPPIIAEINVTPLVDVFLLLLIIFMVTSSALTTSNIPVNLPQASHSTEGESKAKGALVTVNSGGEFFINGKATPDDAFLAGLSEALSATDEKLVIIEGDREAVLGRIVYVMDEGKKAGALKFAFSTSPSSNRPSK